MGGEVAHGFSTKLVTLNSISQRHHSPNSANPPLFGPQSHARGPRPDRRIQTSYELLKAAVGGVRKMSKDLKLRSEGVSIMKCLAILHFRPLVHVSCLGSIKLSEVVRRYSEMGLLMNFSAFSKII